jgi:hypothetical protein
LTESGALKEIEFPPRTQEEFAQIDAMHAVIRGLLTITEAAENYIKRDTSVEARTAAEVITVTSRGLCLSKLLNPLERSCVCPLLTTCFPILPLDLDLVEALLNMPPPGPAVQKDMIVPDPLQYLNTIVSVPPFRWPYLQEHICLPMLRALPWQRWAVSTKKTALAHEVIVCLWAALHAHTIITRTEAAINELAPIYLDHLLLSSTSMGLRPLVPAVRDGASLWPPEVFMPTQADPVVLPPPEAAAPEGKGRGAKTAKEFAFEPLCIACRKRVRELPFPCDFCGNVAYCSKECLSADHDAHIPFCSDRIRRDTLAVATIPARPTEPIKGEGAEAVGADGEGVADHEE